MIKLKVKNCNKFFIIAIIISLVFFIQSTICEAKSSTGSFKSYMSYTSITDETSDQYKMQNNNMSYTDNIGLRRYMKTEGIKNENDFYMVAVGNYYAQNKCGGKFHVILDSEIEFDIIVGDIKNNKDTDEENKICMHNGSIIEFIVDIDMLSEKSRIDGDIREMDGNILSIEEIIE